MNKKLLLSFISITLLAGFLLPIGIAAIEIQNPLSAPDFKTLINNIINFIYWIAIAAVPLAIIIGGAYFLTAGGKPENVETGKKIITYAIIGLAIVLLARGLTSVITGVLGG